MSFSANEYGRSIAAPGLVFQGNPYTSMSGCMADSKDSEGGFPLWKKTGVDAKVFSTKPSEGTPYFFGIAQRIATRDEYPIGTPVSVITKGQVWVVVSEDVKSGNAVYLNSDGEFVSSATTSTSGSSVSNTAITGAKYITSAASGGFAVVELN